MKAFPLFLKTTGKRILIFGGGEQAAQKTRLAAKTDALIEVIAPALAPELEGLAATGAIRWRQCFEGSPEDVAFALVATGCPGADAATAAMTKAMSFLTNVVDAPALCDAYTPAIVDRDPLVVAIGTEGTAPVLGRLVKSKIEAFLEPGLGALAALAGRLRARVARTVEKKDRRAFWAWVFDGSPRALHGRGDHAAAARAIEGALEAGCAPDAGLDGFVSLVGAGPGAADLVTLRGVKRLQEADVILYDRLVGPGVLELARRDAERIDVGKAPGAHAWRQEAISARLVAEARLGKRVVRLKGGDPSLFARCAEEIEALRAAAIPFEMVPGVTQGRRTKSCGDDFVHEFVVPSGGFAFSLEAPFSGSV